MPALTKLDLMSTDSLLACHLFIVSLFCTSSQLVPFSSVFGSIPEGSGTVFQIIPEPIKHTKTVILTDFHLGIRLGSACVYHDMQFSSQAFFDQLSKVFCAQTLSYFLWLHSESALFWLQQTHLDLTLPKNHNAWKSATMGQIRNLYRPPPTPYPVGSTGSASQRNYITTICF